MNASSTENPEFLQESQPQPGRRLKLAREAKGLELSRVAGQLHLSTVMVRALEEDNYADLPARVFVRGYYKNYARIMGIPEDKILQDFEKRCPNGECEDELRTVSRKVRPEVRSSHALVRFVTWAIVVGLLILLVVWWRGYISWGDDALFNGAEEEGSVSEESAELVTPLLPPLESPEMTGFQREEPAVRPGEGAVEPRTIDGKDESAATDLPAPAAETPAQPVAVVVSDPGSVKPPSTPAVTSGILLEFSGPCWVDVRDSTRKYKLSRELKAGDSRVLGGTPPYRVVLGNYRVVKLSIDGTPYDLSVHADDNAVARFVLDPAASNL